MKLADLLLVPLRSGHVATVDARSVEGTGTLYFCAKDWCPHYQGQLGLLAGADAMHCALVQYPPDRICQPFYLEVAEALDHNRRQTWEQRLGEAEAFETAVATAAADAPSGLAAANYEVRHTTQAKDCGATFTTYAGLDIF